MHDNVQSANRSCEIFVATEFRLGARGVRIGAMTHIAGSYRSQTLLLPESLDDYVGPENPVRFIEAFVDGLDLTTAGFARVTPKVTGRPGNTCACQTGGAGEDPMRVGGGRSFG